MIKRAVTLIAAILLVAAVSLAGGQKRYGKDLTLKEKTKISDILASPEKFKGKKVLVEGPIVDVCKERGCWIKIGSDKEFESIRIKVDDGVIIFPLDAKGKDAKAEGVVSVRTVSVEDQIKQGEEMAKEETTTFDKSTVKGPKTIIQIKGEGAVIK
ncbi:MAG TPA: hypothetical protein DGH68_09130 [Bacteroidetes bacterium]|jgi:hypothetical protein|nr:hypothetical protein [Bacteroidota bacterium]